MQSRTTALIVAAGSGTRVGGDLPKQYASIAGKAVLAHAIDALAAHPRIDEIRVVIGAGHEALYAAAVGGRDIAAAVIGGATRRESVGWRRPRTLWCSSTTPHVPFSPPRW
jgi:2-C-methyl-D-erythritol 4-phosphate cytidylyltransferase / 2-C-methyl-D-erythritol 2,4-cyclodiphosphate synthase